MFYCVYIGLQAYGFIRCTAGILTVCKSQAIEMEAVKHAFCWIAARGDRQTIYAIIFTNSMSFQQEVKIRVGSPDWPVIVFDIHLSRLCGCIILDMPVMREMTD